MRVPSIECVRFQLLFVDMTQEGLKDCKKNGEFSWNYKSSHRVSYALVIWWFFHGCHQWESLSHHIQMSCPHPWTVHHILYDITLLSIYFSTSSLEQCLIKRVSVLQDGKLTKNWSTYLPLLHNTYDLLTSWQTLQFVMSLKAWIIFFYLTELFLSTKATVILHLCGGDRGQDSAYTGKL